MTRELTEAKVEFRCDRCREVFDPATVEPSPQTMREWWQTEPEIDVPRSVRRWFRKAAISSPRLEGRPRIMVSEIHFCSSCFWEFDMLFCQGRPTPWSPYRKPHLIPENPYLEPKEKTP